MNNGHEARSSTERNGISRGESLQGDLAKINEMNLVPDERKTLTADSQDFVVGEMIGSRIFQTRNLRNSIYL